MIVVSLMSEQWSPKMAPSSTAEPARIRMMCPSGWPRESWATSGIATGIRMPIVPQLVPVENAMNEASPKTVTGSTQSGTSPISATR